MSASAPGAYLDEARREFRSLKRLVEKAIAQVPDTDFFTPLDADSNSVGILVKHIGGNLRSRWTAFLATDGEKPDRRRDSEFEREPGDTRANLLERWEAGWETLFATLETLVPGDLSREVSIRGEAHSVLRAINRSLTHCAVHAGQIVMLSRHLAAGSWQTLSIARGKSEEFNLEKKPGPR